MFLKAKVTLGKFTSDMDKKVQQSRIVIRVYGPSLSYKGSQFLSSALPDAERCPQRSEDVHRPLDQRQLLFCLLPWLRPRGLHVQDLSALIHMEWWKDSLHRWAV